MLHSPTIGSSYPKLDAQPVPLSIGSEFRARAARIASSTAPFPELLRLRGLIKSMQTGAVAEFTTGGSVAMFQKARARLADDVLCGVLYTGRCKALGRRQASLLPLAAVAIGGYGRGGLAPASDIDVLFILPGRNADIVCAQTMLEFAIPALWDLGFKLDHITLRVPEYRELAASDLKLLTGSLDARLVWGCPALHNELLETREATLTQELRAALAHRLAAESRQRGKCSPRHSAQEPNLKCGPGGLRDIQCLDWLERLQQIAPAAVRGEANQLSTAANILSNIRCHIHLLAGHEEDRLRADLQTTVASRIGLTPLSDYPPEDRLLKLVSDHMTHVEEAVHRNCK